MRGAVAMAAVKLHKRHMPPPARPLVWPRWQRSAAAKPRVPPRGKRTPTRHCSC